MVWGSIAGILIPGFSLAQNQQPVVSAPETIEDAFGFVFSILKSMPQAIKEAFGSAWEIWRNVVGWLWMQWDNYIGSWIRGLWHSFLGIIGQEVEKRKPLIERELEKERQEVQQEVLEQTEKAGQNLWERLKGLIKDNL